MRRDFGAGSRSVARGDTDILPIRTAHARTVRRILALWYAVTSDRPFLRCSERNSCTCAGPTRCGCQPPKRASTGLRWCLIALAGVVFNKILKSEFFWHIASFVIMLLLWIFYRVGWSFWDCGSTHIVSSRIGCPHSYGYMYV